MDILLASQTISEPQSPFELLARLKEPDQEPFSEGESARLRKRLHHLREVLALGFDARDGIGAAVDHHAELALALGAAAFVMGADHDAAEVADAHGKMTDCAPLQAGPGGVGGSTGVDQEEGFPFEHAK